MLVAERDYTNDSQDELEIDGHCYRRTLQMTSNKEIQRILEIKEDGDEIIQHLTHSLESMVDGNHRPTQAQPTQAQALARRLDEYRDGLCK